MTGIAPCGNYPLQELLNAEFEVADYAVRSFFFSKVTCLYGIAGFIK